MPSRQMWSCLIRDRQTSHDINMESIRWRWSGRRIEKMRWHQITCLFGVAVAHPRAWFFSFGAEFIGILFIWIFFSLWSIWFYVVLHIFKLLTPCSCRDAACDIDTAIFVHGIDSRVQFECEYMCVCGTNGASSNVHRYFWQVSLGAIQLKCRC